MRMVAQVICRATTPSRSMQKAVTKLLPTFGGEPLLAGDVTFLGLGQVEELWDEVGLVRYPNRGALWVMSTSKTWQKVGVHRAAGLEGQLNIEIVEQSSFAPRMS